MGLQIECDEDAPIPRPEILILTCDRPEGFFCRGSETFREDDYLANRKAAGYAGWVEKQTSSGRIFICPDCQ